ncbi:unnamed protein product [Symbiodinium sp. CCMP2592]|nr:unnamed protein product [Symbiodinium sp. CCMP2592]
MDTAHGEECWFPPSAATSPGALLQRLIAPPVGRGGRTSQLHWAEALLDQTVQLNATTTTASANQSAAAVEGVHANQAGDLDTFLVALATNCGIVIMAILGLSLLRCLQPAVYQRDLELQHLHVEAAKLKPDRDLPGPPGCLAWLFKSFSTSPEEAASVAGLDVAMHCEFLAVAMRLCLSIGLPCILILCPLHAIVGGDVAGPDRLSQVGMANVQHGSWLCWLHAIFVWYVVVVTHAQVHVAQRNFMPLRMRWLHKSPVPSATTILVQGIPEHLLSEAALRKFFDDGVFGCQAVKCIDFVKDTRELLYWQEVAAGGAGGQGLGGQGSQRWRTGTGRVLEGQELQAAAASMVSRYRKQLLRLNDKNSSNAFITFNHQREAVVAQKLLTEDDYDGIRAEPAPDPSQVLWGDLATEPGHQAVKELVGYFLIFLVFWGFMPLVVLIQSVANLNAVEEHVHVFKVMVEQFPALATLWNGIMASFALSVAMSFLPSCLMLIFVFFFISKTEAERQHRLQVWYFYFLCVFVLLVTAIGSSIMATGQYLLQHPFDAPGLLARNMPRSTHFYLNFIPMQMAAYATAALRLPQLLKYMAFRILQSKDAKARSEPEDQTYFGIGSRSARASLQLVTVLTFSTLSPLISILGFMMFAVCRATHGFLLREAESVKLDLGGVFWETSLRHVLQGLFIFVLLMTGVLAERSGNWIPSAVSASSLVFVQWSNVTFRRRYRWRHLQFEEILKMPETRNKRPSSGENYRQPELGMMFVTFALTFLTLKDEDRSSGYVLLNLFQALFLTDSDGAESISGIDIGHQQTLDFGIEMYTGDGSHLLLIVTTVIMLFATSIFSLVLLNLTIGMYTKFYELQEPLARLGLQQCRARLCVRFALRPSVPRTWLAGMSLEGSKWKTCLCALPFVVIFLASAIFESWNVYSGGLCLCAVLLIFQAALLINVDDLDSRHRYLWVSYRSDYSENFYMNQDAEITQLKSELQDAERRQSEDIAKIAGDVRRLEQSVKACCDLLRGKPQDTPSCTPQ